MVERHRRYWSLDEKRSICRQASVPGVSVAQVALRYSMNTNLIFKWLRDSRFSPALEADEAVFLPVEISSSTSTEVAVPPEPISAPVGRLRIDLAGGHRIVAEGDFDADALGRLLKGWLS